jgi:hypothetical protein
MFMKTKMNVLKGIRRLRVKTDINDVFDKDEIIVEYADYPNHFYSETKKSHNDVPINLETICNFLEYDDLFELIEIKDV